MNNDVVKNFILKSKHDLGSAKTIFQNNPDYTDTITFHSQQTIEKVLKGFLTFHQVKAKYNHDIIRLIQDCTTIDQDFQSFLTSNIVELNEIGMSVRYDDIQNDPNKEDAFEYMELASEISEFVLKKLSEKGFNI